MGKCGVITFWCPTSRADDCTDLDFATSVPSAGKGKSVIAVPPLGILHLRSLWKKAFAVAFLVPR